MEDPHNLDIARLKEKEEENDRLRDQVSQLEARVLELADVVQTLRQDIKVKFLFMRQFFICSCINSLVLLM